MSSERLLELTGPALQSQSLPNAEVARRSGLSPQRVEELVGGASPTLEEVKALRAGLGEAFDPTPQLARQVTPLRRRQELSADEKLDLVLKKLARLEAEVLEMKDLLTLVSRG